MHRDPGTVRPLVFRPLVIRPFVIALAIASSLVAAGCRPDGTDAPPAVAEAGAPGTAAAPPDMAAPGAPGLAAEARSNETASLDDTPPADPWLGTWFGPEGTFVDITRHGERYTLMVQSLDGPSSYQAVLEDDTLAFERDGKPLSLRRTDGKGTGMKWLADRKDCLVVVPGEGFCRDTPN
jgi:hypothetical protein